MEEYKAKVKDTQTDKHNKLIYLYTNDVKGHHSYIASQKHMDMMFWKWIISLTITSCNTLNTKVEISTFVRVDSETPDQLVQKEEKKRISIDQTRQDK